MDIQQCIGLCAIYLDFADVSALEELFQSVTVAVFGYQSDGVACCGLSGGCLTDLEFAERSAVLEVLPSHSDCLQPSKHYT